MIIGTAGHIDHGKTALTRALTGVDTDRLAEEKRRGITIEPGFAWLPLPRGGIAGVIDLPRARPALSAAPLIPAWFRSKAGA